MPASPQLRPTTDKVRGAIFDVLVHAIGIEFAAMRVLDLFAGTGALGIEALSRGAPFCLAVERSRSGCATIAENAVRFGLNDILHILCRDATRLRRVRTQEPFDLIFLDPPYGKGLGERALATAIGAGWLTRGAFIVWEEARRTQIVAPAGCAVTDARSYGDTRVHFLAYE